MLYLTICNLGLNLIALLFLNDSVCSDLAIHMGTGNKAPAPFSGRHFLRRVLLLYSALIVYGSFIPFHFNFDPVFLKWRLGRFLTRSLRRACAIFPRRMRSLIFCCLRFLAFSGRPSLNGGGHGLLSEQCCASARLVYYSALPSS